MHDMGGNTLVVSNPDFQRLRVLGGVNDIQTKAQIEILTRKDETGWRVDATKIARVL